MSIAYSKIYIRKLKSIIFLSSKLKIYVGIDSTCVSVLKRFPTYEHFKNDCVNIGRNYHDEFIRPRNEIVECNFTFYNNDTCAIKLYNIQKCVSYDSVHTIFLSAINTCTVWCNCVYTRKRCV